MIKRVVLIVAMLAFVSACTSTVPSSNDDGSPLTVADLPEGDVARGEMLYNEGIRSAPNCIGCHMIGPDSDTPAVPGFYNYAELAATRVEGQSAEEYTFEAILYPARHIPEGYNNIMYGNYISFLTAQDMADLIAYLLEL